MMPQPAVSHHRRQPQDARHIDGGAKVHLLAELIAADEAHRAAGRRRPTAARSRPATRRAHCPSPSPATSAPAASPAVSRRPTARGGGAPRAWACRGTSRRCNRSAARPSGCPAPARAATDRQIAQLQPVAALDAASHDQVGHVGRQDGRGQLEGAEAHRQRQPDAATAAGRQADAVGIASTMGISSAMRPMFDGMTKASR